jgi:hypothetical protein
VRIEADPGSSYARDPSSNSDKRFRDSMGAIQSIVTSGAQNDSGVFELSLRDERYLPFEGAGAISRWQIELPRHTNRFDFNSISDVILHLKYTARDGGKRLAQAAVSPPLSGLRLFNVRHEFPADWYRFLQQTDALTFDLRDEMFPYHLPEQKLTVNNVTVYLKIKLTPTRGKYDDSVPLEAALKVNNLGGTQTRGFRLETQMADIVNATFPVNAQTRASANLIFGNVPSLLRLTGTTRLDPAVVEECFLLCSYSLT